MLAEVVPEAGRRFGDAPALVAPDGTPLSYRDLDRFSDEVACGLAGAGVGIGDVVALTLPSVPEYVVAYAAVAKLGAITAGVNVRLTAVEQARLLEVVAPRLVLTDVAEVMALREDGEAPAPLPNDPDRPVVVVFTSGTTGTPRAALFCERQLRAICQLDFGDGWGSGSPMLTSTPFPHVGFTTKLPWYLRSGSTQLLFERWRADDALRLASEWRLRVLGAVPTQLAMMLRVADRSSYDLSSLQTIVLGAGPSSAALVAEAIRELGVSVSVRYSSTESGGAGCAADFTSPPDADPIGVGLPRGPIIVSVRDEAGEPVPTGEVGEVCLRTPTAMARYWGDDAATDAAFWSDACVRTGDLGRVDERGWLYLAGRAKEMYIRGGYNVYPLEVESVLAAHPLVAEVAVVPRPDPVFGEVGVAIVVASDAARPPTLAQLRSFAGERLGSHKLPDEVRLIDALPLTAMHKVDRRALQASLREPA